MFCDITPDTYCLSPESLERQIQAVLAEGKLTPKAVVAVDILGNPCDYDVIVPICEKYSLFLIEDAAQSFGASYHGKKACSFGHEFPAGRHAGRRAAAEAQGPGGL